MVVGSISEGETFLVYSISKSKCSLSSKKTDNRQGEITLAESHAHIHGLAHHFNTMEQQKEAGMVGMWLFLLTEIMFFGGLFLAYTIYRTTYPTGFLHGSHLLNV